MSDKNVGSILDGAREKAMVSITQFFGAIVYLAMVLYSGVHNWQLMSLGVQPDMMVWAGLGVVALEITAVFLPVALHYWCHSPVQRFTAYAFYGLDLLLVFLNVVLSFALTAGTSRPVWFESYLLFIVPATPLIAGAGWSLLFLLDSSQRERAVVQALRVSTRDALAVRMAEFAKGDSANSLVETSAEKLAEGIIADSLNVSLNGNAKNERSLTRQK